MSIDHLRRYYRLPARATPHPPTSSPSEGLETLLDGRIEAMQTCSSFVLDNVFPAHEERRSHQFGHLTHVSGHRLAMACKDPELVHLDMRTTLFLDTETTGLGMGAGTRVFLVGAGYLDGDSFRVKQFFLRAYGDEEPYLAEFAEFLQSFNAIVTFNGKAFDWPLLEGRYLYHRRIRHGLLKTPLHVDLLHPARRLWKLRLQSCALSSLESSILGITRTREDVPGYLIPSLYFQYQRSGNGHALTGVFYHNLQDILSLAMLAVHMDQLLDDPMCGLVEAGLDFYSLGKMFDRAGHAELAAQCFEESLRRGIQIEHRPSALVALATVQKRQRWWEGAMYSWDLLIEEGGGHALYALVEMAKFFEHVERDYGQAIEHVRQALSMVELHGSRTLQIDLQALEHRLARLMSRSSRVRWRQ